ncbi:hypothetical protein F0224_13805 [Vibrio coralliilyticus]|uniref:hypothetical protein n=1 Tax=Vibrio coralliilyticus TaxID=190893 RepID=UPI000BAC1F5A|nr:hypothetical protein [Vibrio coralliilyticus]NOI76761.1 hypothetical protein [Vibrio coralliilyticus]PAW03476.1 hypothetical protein CKJ79_12245 [Vibrio coralliilyticus]
MFTLIAILISLGIKGDAPQRLSPHFGASHFSQSFNGGGNISFRKNFKKISVIGVNKPQILFKSMDYINKKNPAEAGFFSKVLNLA